MKAYISEMIGTFGLVLVGAGSIALNMPHFWISVCFGVIVTLMILSFGKISGAHINPAVSIAFYFYRNEKKALWYIPFQLIGGLLAGLFLLYFLPENPTYGETLPSGSLVQTFLIEVFITFLLMLSILIIIQTDHLPKIAIVVGFVVFLAAFFAGPFTGASMNPARSFGPAIVSNQLEVLWLYFLAPIIGAVLAVPIFNFLRKIRTK
ncbi:MIP/aquaporin family protein [Ekhidna sp.]